MTHDLIRNMLETFAIHVEKVEVSDLKDNTFFAIIHLLDRDQQLIQMDARPSDAIALALRAKAPIFVQDHVFEKSAKIDTSGQEAVKEEGAKKWTEVLEGLSPEDFGKYKM
jgi:hypothetical protein